ncbi:transposase InsO family protein, partial [Kitasatospora sp. GP30]|nr:transposase InsO family protein [Kitasatospora sp. GP30]
GCSETGQSGSEGGRAEKGLHRQAPRRSADPTRTLLDEWAYARPYRSEQERRDAFPAWLHTYNHHRGHTALRGKPPVSRVPNLTGQYT